MITLSALDHTKVYILGVSGGPDSMALFDMCIKEGIQVVAAHVNYQIRDSAYRDMKLVEDYACVHHIPCHIHMQEQPIKGNFEAFAREVRYRFYKELMEQYQADGVLLAHHMDDHIETYLMQQQRASEGVVWGISDQTYVMNCLVLRPLLHLCKEDILTYCEQKQVPYGIDETNLESKYTRNKIRHHIVDHMSYEEKVALIEEITARNEEKKQQQRRWNDFFINWDHRCKTLLSLQEEMEQALFYYVYETCHVTLSHHEVTLVCTLIRKQKDGWVRTIANQYEIYQEYGRLCIDIIKDTSYQYTYETIHFEQTPFFKIATTGSSTEALTLHEDDFPICIRSYQEGDSIQLRFGNKKVNRWFIDRKIPKKERKTWPVVTNRHGFVILVPKIGCDIEHFSNNPTLFVLK